jgi:zinc protease
VLIGQATGLRFGDADSLPLRAALSVLGNGFTSRLMGRVRDKEGLTYHIGGGVGGDTFADGYWGVDASFAPALLDKGLISTQRELRLWRQDGITVEELAAPRDDERCCQQHLAHDTTGAAIELPR